MLDFNKLRSFTKYYIINGTTSDNKPVNTDGRMHEHTFMQIHFGKYGS
jgi:hypothetical protein